MVACPTGDTYSLESCELMFLLNLHPSSSHCAVCLFQVWAAVRSDLVKPAAGHTGMQLCPFSIILGLLHFKVFLWDGGVWNHH